VRLCMGNLRALILFVLLLQPLAVFAGSLKSELEQLEQDLVALDREVAKLETDLEGIVDAPLRLYFSTGEAAGFSLHSLEIRLGERLLVSHSYRERERAALKDGNLQPLFEGHIPQGSHQLAVQLNGTGGHQIYQEEITLRLDKDASVYNGKLVLTAQGNIPGLHIEKATSEQEPFLSRRAARFMDATGDLSAAGARADYEGSPRRWFKRVDEARKEGRVGEAAEELARAPNSFWTALGYYNMALAYGYKTESRSRSNVSFRVARALAGETGDQELADFAAYSLLVESALSLERGEPERALTLLHQFPTANDHLPIAIYLQGLAYANNGEWRSALQSWHRIREYPAAYPGVMDSWHGRARAMEQLGMTRQASRLLAQTHSRLEMEQTRLDTLLAEVQASGAYERLAQEKGRRSQLEWYLRGGVPGNNRVIAWFNQFLVSPEHLYWGRQYAWTRERAQQLQDRLETLALHETNLSNGSGDATLLSRVRSAVASTEDGLARSETLHQGVDQRFTEHFIVYLQSQQKHMRHLTEEGARLNARLLERVALDGYEPVSRAAKEAR